MLTVGGGEMWWNWVKKKGKRFLQQCDWKCNRVKTQSACLPFVPKSLSGETPSCQQGLTFSQILNHISPDTMNKASIRALMQLMLSVEACSQTYFFTSCSVTLKVDSQPKCFLSVTYLELSGTQVSIRPHLSAPVYVCVQCASMFVWSASHQQPAVWLYSH